jgi:hypothetical protein
VAVIHEAHLNEVLAEQFLRIVSPFISSAQPFWCFRDVLRRTNLLCKDKDPNLYASNTQAEASLLHQTTERIPHPASLRYNNAFILTENTTQEPWIWHHDVLTHEETLVRLELRELRFIAQDYISRK